MKIGVLGSGTVGQTLASGFIKHGYEVMIASRDLGKLNEWKDQNKKGKVGSFEEAAKFGEIIVLAVKGRGAEEALKLAFEKNLEGKIIIDVTNPIDDNVEPINGVIKFFTNLDESLMERLQKSFPKARFVKAFNSIGASCMVNPDFKEKATMFICGNDENAKKEVSIILDKFGFQTEDLGMMEASRAIEPLCMLWCIPGFLKNDWHHGLRILRK